MAKSPLLSVIIPAHNEEGYIEETLESIADQSYKNFEVIVVCDSCNDDTSNIAISLGVRTFNVRFKNTAKSRNYGAKQSQGEILVFHDADTIASRNYLKEMAKWTKRGYDFGCARLRSETSHPLGLLSAQILNYYSLIRKYFHGNSFVRKSLFLEVGGYDEKLKAGEDTDLAERLKRKGRFKFLHNVSLISSERKFKEEGYFKHFWKKGEEGREYLRDRKEYLRKHRQ